MTKRNVAVVGLLAVGCWSLLFCALALPRCAWAQDVDVQAHPNAPQGHPRSGNAEEPALDPAQLAAAPELPDEFYTKAFDAFAIDDWWALGALGVLALTWSVKSGAASKWLKERAPAVSAFLLDPVVLFLVPLGLSGVPLTIAAVKSGSPFTVGLLAGTIIKVNGGAKVVFLGLKNVVERRAIAKAKGEASKAAIAAVPPAALPLLLLLPSLLLSSSCSSVKGYLVSAQTLDEAGAQFEVAGPIFNKACAEQKLPLDTCRSWRDFATRFKVLYRPSANAWHAAALVNEAAVERRYSDMVGPLLAELARFGAVLTSQGLLPNLVPGGEP